MATDKTGLRGWGRVFLVTFAILLCVITFVVGVYELYFYRYSVGLPLGVLSLCVSGLCVIVSKILLSGRS